MTSVSVMNVLTTTWDDEDDEEDEDDHPLAQQVGGSHYKDMAIQPIEFHPS
jgi:hypothetical protein